MSAAQLEAILAKRERARTRTLLLLLGAVLVVLIGVLVFIGNVDVCAFCLCILPSYHTIYYKVSRFYAGSRVSKQSDPSQTESIERTKPA